MKLKQILLMAVAAILLYVVFSSGHGGTERFDTSMGKFVKAKDSGLTAVYFVPTGKSEKYVVRSCTQCPNENACAGVTLMWQQEINALADKGPFNCSQITPPPPPAKIAPAPPPAPTQIALAKPPAPAQIAPAPTPAPGPVAPNANVTRPVIIPHILPPPPASTPPPAASSVSRPPPAGAKQESLLEMCSRVLNSSAPPSPPAAPPAAAPKPATPAPFQSILPASWIAWLESLFSPSTTKSETATTPPKEKYENYPFHSSSFDQVNSARFAPF